MPFQFAKNTPFAEQLEFFRQKLQLPTERWDDIMRSAHDRAFIVAGAANADLLNDLHHAIAKNIETGAGLGVFRRDFAAIVQKHGWTGWTGQGTEAGEAWRTRIIYQTNLSTSYAAGRWRQLMDPKLLKISPYWKYIHADGVAHPRPLHVSWHGLVLHHEHPFWKTHFPINGWGCHCRVTAVDGRAYAAAQAQGKAEPPPGWQDIDSKTGAPRGIDKGFDYAPGASVHRPLKDFIDERLVRLAAPIGSRMYDVLKPLLQAEQRVAFTSFVDAVFADPVKRGRSAVVGALDDLTLGWLMSNKGIEPASAEIAVLDGLLIGRKAQRHQAAGDALSEDDWHQLFDALANPVQILFDTNSGKLLYVLAPASGKGQKLAVEFDYLIKKRKGEVNLIVSAFKVLLDSIEAGVRAGIYEKVR